VQAAAVGIGLAPFLVISVPARLGRFLAVTLLCWWVGEYLLARWALRSKLAMLLLGWIGFYSFYLTLMPN